MKLTRHTYACNSLTDFAFQALAMNGNGNYGNLLKLVGRIDRQITENSCEQYLLADFNQNEGVYLHPQILPGIKANHVPLKDCITLYNPRFSKFPPALCRTSKWRFHNSVRYGGRCKVEVGN